MKSKLFSSFIILSLFLLISASEDYLKNVQDWVDKVYQTIYDIECIHTKPYPNSYESMIKMKRINCCWSTSITYQQAGLIKKGKSVCHTPSINDKESIQKHYDVPDLKKSLQLTMINAQNLKKGSCDLIKVMKKYKELPIWLRQKGVIYLQDSNICIAAGNKKIYSCNLSGQQYGRGKHQVLRKDKNGGYPFTSLILWAVLPRSNGKSNIPENSPFKHIPC